MGKHLYMKVTKDKYELPEIVCDSAKELAEICGVKRDTIYTAISNYKQGRSNFSIFKKVEIGDDDL
jgi:hypothetical protein